MYRNLAVLNGMLIAIMISLNGILANKIGPYLSTLIFHALGLLLISLISFIKKNTLPRLKRISAILLLPGVLSVLTILLNNLSIPKIGVTLSVGIGLFAQLIMSSLVEHFGLLGMPINKLKKEKIIGLFFISLGIIIMIIK